MTASNTRHCTHVTHIWPFRFRGFKLHVRVGATALWPVPTSRPLSSPDSASLSMNDPSSNREGVGVRRQPKPPPPKWFEIPKEDYFEGLPYFLRNGVDSDTRQAFPEGKPSRRPKREQPEPSDSDKRQLAKASSREGQMLPTRPLSKDRTHLSTHARAPTPD